jgi:cytochrome c oxidase subunit 3
MAHAVLEEERPLHMGLPIGNGKLAMWLFLVTEIMFFTGLIGTYIVLRNGSRSWPTPHQVHLIEWVGAFNTFVLICSSLTVVLAHWAIGKGNVKLAALYVVITLVLGAVFLAVKAFEYNSKFAHNILPGHIFERFDAPNGPDSLGELRRQLSAIVEGKTPAKTDAKEACAALLAALQVTPDHPPLSAEELAARVNKIHGMDPDMHLTPAIQYGNLWASCYFAMTGFHALHVLGGLVVFIIILTMAAVGRLGVQHTSMLELTGLYWHFVDIVWIFLFPLLYLI